MESKEIHVTCECGSEILKVEYWEDEDQFCMVQFRYCPLRYSFKRRIKFLFTGQIEFNEVILSKHNALNLSSFIISNTLNNE